MTKNLTQSNFNETISQTAKPVIVDFWAEWCGPCRMLTPIIESLADEFNDDIIVAKVNIDEEMELARTYGVMSIPTVIIFDKGEVVDNSVGVRDKNFYTNNLKRIIKDRAV